MLQFALQSLIGVLAAAAFILVMRRFGHSREISAYSSGLLVAAVIYVGFGLLAPSIGWKIIEILGVFIYLPFVILGRKRSPIWLAIGWALHAVWDMPFHMSEAEAFVPQWYPGVCLGFDLFLSGYITFFRRGK